VKAEQQFDLIAEANWEMCMVSLGVPSGAILGDLCFKHRITLGHDISARHYDTPCETMAIQVRDCVRFEGKNLYQKIKGGKRCPELQL